MEFTIGSEKVAFRIERLIVAGWTGRDTAGVQHHIDELAELGVAPPSTTPLFYQVSSSLLTQAPSIQVLGASTSGECEPLLVKQNGALWLGLASDHTDRDLEATSVAASKQACPKVCAPQLWELRSVVDHIEQLRLRSWIKESGDWVSYQDGDLCQILPIAQLADHLEGMENAAMLCGTLPAIGGVRAATEFRAEIFDPITKKAIKLEYRTETLKIII